ncbi:hypothetical protein C4546_03590 [Candidatus Parcubacteria bacterium]|nr:MAG: hypothetical protein C4546_03590 [Candidatus Parcubacteria bacterium]
MKKVLGYGYTNFLYRVKQGYGEVFYLYSDFPRLWKLIKKQTTRKKNYLKILKQIYEKTYQQQLKFYRSISAESLRRADDAKLLEILKQGIYAQRDSVGIGHAIEPIGMCLEEEFRNRLLNEIPDPKEFKRFYSTLLAPSSPSFVAEEEQELQKILKSPKAKRRRLLALHAKKYYWLRGTFAGSQKADVKFFQKRLAKLDPKPLIRNQVAKNRLIKKLGLSKNIRSEIRTIDFLTIWQDERKKNMMISFTNTDLILNEVARRVGIPLVFLRYLNAWRVLEMRSLREIRDMKTELKTRYQGVFILVSANTEKVLTGKAYKVLEKTLLKTKIKKRNQDIEIHGVTANGGTVIGRVRVCMQLSTIGKVKPGEVLVTSMTRPEFMPAVKKASAIVTDEGGITCHAAIVARELNIPAVIGTRIATKVLKDGMLVEVKANHGVVKILKAK